MKPVKRIALASAMVLVLMSMLIISIASARPALSIVPLTNPGFDSDLSGWVASGFVWDSVGHDAPGSALSSAGGSFAGQTITSTYSGVYTFSVWSIRSLTDTVPLNLVLTDEPDGVDVYSQDCYPAVGVWSNCFVSGYFTSGLSVIFGFQIVSDVPLWVDDASLVDDEQIPPPTNTPTVYYTCTLGTGGNHLFDFGFVTSQALLTWRYTFSAISQLRGIVADFGATWTNGGQLRVETNDFKTLFLQSSTGTGIQTRTVTYCADSLYGNLPGTHYACNAIGSFPGYTTYLSDLNGPGNVTINFIASANTINGPGYMQINMYNLRAIYYGTPDEGCNQEPMPTLTPTPTGHPTSTPPPTNTPGASPTPWATPTLVPTPGGNNPPGGITILSFNPGDIQGAIDVISDTSGSVDTIVTTIDTRVDVNTFIIHGWSPFAFARAILMLLDEFEWLRILFLWFIGAFCIIMAITAIRLVISLWGIIERIISIIKLIPFVGLLVVVVFVARPVHAQTPTPTVTATPIPDYIVHDYHFIYPQMLSTDSDWLPTGGASWSFSRYTIPAGGSISQYVDPTALAGSHPFIVSVKAQANVTSTFGVTAEGIQHTFTITRVGHLARTYTYTDTFSLPTSVTVAAISGGPIMFDSVGLEAEDIVGPAEVAGAEVAGAYEHPMVKPHSLDLASFVDWFTPIDLHPVFTWDVTSSDWFRWFTTITGPVAATMMQFMTPRVIHMYIAFRILLMCVLWFIGFVMQKIGKPIPATSGAHTITIAGTNYGSSRYNWSGLPRLPASGIRMGGGRRRRGGF